MPKSGDMRRAREKYKAEYIILPESLHEARGLTSDGKIDYQPENLDWYNWKIKPRKWNFKETD